MDLISRLKENRDNGNYPFHMPGHKRRLAGDPLFEEVYALDITETEGFDNLHNAKGIIKEAEEKAAGCFGADETHFLVNGSTGGILAAITASVSDKDDVIIAANCHRSVYNAVMLSGARPYIITPEEETHFEIYGGIEEETVRDAFSHVNAKAVVITSPTYEGITSNIGSIAKCCHENNAVLIVDAAHGAHFAFSGAFPEDAVTSGADVVVTSVHKTLPAMTQTALIHISEKCSVKDRIRRMLTVFQTSSPSYILMASIDSMTELLNAQGDKLFGEYAKRLEAFYERSKNFEHLDLLSKEKLTAAGSADHDRSKIVVRDTTQTFTGKQLSDLLRSRHGIVAEMAGPSYAILMTAVADTDKGFERLYNALSDIDSLIKCDRPKEDTNHSAGRSAGGRMLTTDMRSAMFADAKTVPIDQAEGRIARDLVTVYPPGIPVTVPGDVITHEAVRKLIEAKNKGLGITGLEGEEIAVIWERSST